ncbi:MAG TPA: hypothetical protein PKD10_01390 [Paracoccaceae bacterium]|nr:hypothetical protein [Paracoccaceae bacterium]
MKGIDWTELAEKGRAQASGLMANLPGRTPPGPLVNPEAAPWQPTEPTGAERPGPMARLRGMMPSRRPAAEPVPVAGPEAAAVPVVHGGTVAPASLVARAIAPLRERLAAVRSSGPRDASPDRMRRFMRTTAVGVATLSAAFAAGNFVQSDLPDPSGATPTAPRTAAAVAVPGPTGIVQLAAPAEPPVAQVAVVAAVPAAPSPGAIARADGPELAPTALSTAAADPAQLQTLPAAETTLAAIPAAPVCPVALDLTARAGGMIDLALSAPCAAGQPVVLHHAGLVFSAALDGQGALGLSLPALDAAGAVTLRFEDGSEALAAAAVDLSGLRRYAIQWQAPDAFALHAYEGGAGFGDPGHVSAASPHLASAGMPQVSGWLARLGDPVLPLVAEVYTFPDAPGAAPSLAIEAEVTLATCGREMLGETLLSVRGLVTAEELTLAMPGCDGAIGDFLVLNNPLSETTLASAAN